MTFQLSVPPPRTESRLTALPVVVIGAGPVGLAAAAHLIQRGQEVVVFEAGPRAGSAMEQWGHTRFFSPWEYVIDDAAAQLLEGTGWSRPEDGVNPTGDEFLRDYLRPLAETAQIAKSLQCDTRVLAVSKEGMDRTRSAGRSGTPYQLQVSGPEGIRSVSARAVIDASGTWGHPNSILASGMPLRDEQAAAHLCGALPDVRGADRERFVGRHTVVVGAGHSAANTLISLGELARERPGTRVTWVVRGQNPTRAFGSDDDELQARGKLGSDVRDLVDAGLVELIDSFEIDDVHTAAAADQRSDGPAVELIGRRDGEPHRVLADQVVNATGFRPDLQMLREVRLAMDDVVEAPRALAGLIDPNLHSCGTVDPHGVAELAHPDADFYIAGMKSYGRAPTFLMVTGYEQVRSIADDLSGDHDAARIVQLDLPETGVCSTGDGGCCA